MKERISKTAKPPDHSSPRRWWKYIARNPALVKVVKKPERYLNSSRQAAIDAIRKAGAL